MARRRSRLNYSAAFQENLQLRQYILNDVTPTEITLRSGSYGSVMKVVYGNSVCAAKKMHDILLQHENEGVESVVTKYYQECQLMASLCHPNITRFLGICFLPGNTLPLLVMERLEMSLDDLLMGKPQLKHPLLLSFLEGISNGLDYLHCRQPSVIHRDLTATNVLLSSSLVAKICDMGNSRIVDMSPGQLATLSKLPGTQVYMPPEAVSEDHRYGPSLDIFSFGHLALYTLIQEFPCNLLPHTYANPTRAGHLLARSEVERRSVYMEKLEAQLGQSYPYVVQLVRQCLDNAPDQRPSSGKVLFYVRKVKREVDRVNGGGVLKQLDIGKVQVAKEMKTMQYRIQEIQASHITEVESLRSQLQEKDEQIQLLQEQLHQKEVDLITARQERRQNHMDHKRHEIRFPFNLEWTSGPDMPFAMSDYIQSVIIKKMMYVGGGFASSAKKMHIVMAYNIISQEWSRLPQYTACHYAMAVVNNQLTLVGGIDIRSDRTTGILGVWDADMREWTCPYNRMPTSRYDASAVEFRQWLIVAGGRSDGNSTRVEILDLHSEMWHYTQPSPLLPWSCMKSAVVGDTWYLMGGLDGDEITDQVYSASLSTLVKPPVTSIMKRIWKTISSLGICSSTPVCVGESLLAVGGRKSRSLKAVSTILRYTPDSDSRWTEVGQLPMPLYDSICTMTSNSRILIAGGSLSRKLYTSSL